MAITTWFVEIKDKGDDYVTRYIPVNADSQEAAGRAAALELSKSPATGQLERVGTIAARQHFEALGVTNLPADSTAITAAPSELTDWQKMMAAQQAEANLGFDPSAETDPALMREAFEFGPGFEAGLRGRGINIGPGGGLEGAIAQRRQRALEDRFFTQEALRPGSGLTTETAYPTFQSFLSGRTGGGDTFTNPLFGQAGAQAARELLNEARGFTAPASQALPSALAGGILNPATTGQGQTLANVALEAGRQRFGSLSRFLPGAEALSQSFLSDNQLNPAGTPMSFADYLNQRIFG